MDNSYNKFESAVIEYFEGVLSILDVYSHRHQLRDYSLRLISNPTTNLTLNDAVASESTISKSLVLSIEVDDGTGKISKLEYEVLIPVPIDDIFVFKGKVRLNLNYMVNNSVVKISPNTVYIDPEYYIVLEDQYKHKRGSEPELIARAGLHKVQWEDYERKVEFVDEPNLDLSDRDPLIKTKLKLLFGLDTNVITQTEIDHIKENFDLDLRDNICNKDFLNTQGMFLKHMKDSKYEVVKKLRQYFHRTGIVSVPVVQAVVDKFYNLRSISSVGMKTPNNLNPVSYEALKSQIILARGQDKGVPYSKMGASYADFIDVIITPDNKNVNRLNETTKVLNIRDEGTYITCYNKDFNMTEVPFIEYLASRVLVSSQVDYELRRVTANGDYECKVSGIKGTYDDYDLIEAEPDMRLSNSVRMIPMVNHSDAVRVSMGARMYSQSIEVLGGEKPRVASGNENLPSRLNQIAPIEGTVSDVTNNYVEIQSNEIDENGESKVIRVDRPVNISGIYGTNISFKNHMKISQTVNKGDLVWTCMSMDRKSNLLSGVNCFVAMINAARPVDVTPIDGVSVSTYEDALVISESAAKKFTHMAIKDVVMEVGPDFKIDGLMLPSHSPLKANDVLCEYENKLDNISRGVRKLKRNLLNDDVFYRKGSLMVPTGVREAYLVDVKYVYGQSPCNEDETVYHLEEVVKKSKSIKKLANINYDYDLINVNDDDMIADPDISYLVKFRLVVVEKLERGDKITNRFGSKGVVAGINPDSRMPRTIDGRIVDIMMNPAAVVSRKNIPQTMEMYLSNLSVMIKSKCNEMLDEGKSLKDVKVFLDKYKFTNYSRMSDEHLETILGDPNSHLQVVTGCYSRYTIENILEMYSELGIPDSMKLRDGATGRPINKPVICGEMYLLKLYHLAGKKSQITVDYSIKQKFVLGSGKESSAGLRQGNMETDALIANNLTKYVEYVDGNDPIKAGWLFAHAVTAGIGFEKAKD